MRKNALVLLMLLSCIAFCVVPCSAAEKLPAKGLTPNAKVDYVQMSDMSDLDLSNPVIPTGDTIKIGVVTAFSGPLSLAGACLFFGAQLVAHDVNKRGGILVDGKKKLIEVIKADNLATVDGTRKAAERMAVQEKVHFLLGSTNSAMARVMEQVADKHKIIALNITSADDMHNAENFTRYGFMTNYSADQLGRGFAYYFGQIRKKEQKFYVLAQDTLGGHAYGESFKRSLKEHFPNAQIVGEDYHKMFLTDYAPYITKVKASGAEVVYCSALPPDLNIFMKQARQMGLKIPIATIFAADPTLMKELGVEGSKGVIVVSDSYGGTPYFKNPGAVKFGKTWHELWKNKWKGDYATPLWENPLVGLMTYPNAVYWAMSVVERAGSTDPEKIIKAWEGDVFQYPSGVVAKMRACDHKAINPLQVSEFVPPEEQKISFNIPPYHWGKDYSFFGPSSVIPMEKALPWMDQNLDRCKGKSNWGE